jgi:fatty-acyl-CoA synthase
VAIDANTLTGALMAASRRYPEGRVEFPDAPGAALTLAELEHASRLRAHALRSSGVGQGEVVGLLPGSSRATLIDLFGIVRAGAAVSVLPTPVGFVGEAALSRRLAAMAGRCGMRRVIADPANRSFAEKVAAKASALTVDDRGAIERGSRPLPDVSPSEPAVVQFTSGSTGRPRGVELPHRAVMAGVSAIIESAAMSARDTLVQWVPLYHDMGLFGLLSLLLCGGRTHLVSPMSFIRNPARIPRLMSDVGATLLTSPNFGYDLLVAAARRDDPASLDLSSWRLAFNGAEPVSAHTVEAFTETFAAAGVRPEVMFPVYGMAEATLAISFPEPGCPPRIIDVDRKRLVSCGRPVAGMSLRITGDDDAVTSPGDLGEIEIRGPSVTPGYYRDLGASAEVFHDGWLRTGDLGLFRDGHLYIAGRRKEMAIIHGQNYFPDDVESVARVVPGVFRGRCVCFPDTSSEGAERLAVVVEVRQAEDAARCADRVRRAVARELAVGAVDVYWAPPYWLTKTTSGKWQRLAARQRLAAELMRN